MEHSHEKGIAVQTIRFLLVAFLTTIFAAPAIAHHPGKRLDEVMGSKEKYFQLIDKSAPDFTLRTADVKAVRLADFRDKVVVLHFIYTGCPDICPLHAERIAQIQEMISQTPMKDRVQFLTITTDPVNDTLQVLRDYGPAHGLKQTNWLFLTTTPEQAEDTTRKLAKQFGHKFIKTDDGYQVHSVVTHIIDRGGRWAANFHGLRFKPINLVLYLNGLTNKQRPSQGVAKPSLWEQVRELF
jgi:protein SCO1/2